MTKKVTADDVRRLFYYDPETGHLIRKVSVNYRALEGQRAGSVFGAHRQVSVLGAQYLEHRVIWLHVYGEWPAGDIDHIDGNGHNNKISNLRDVDKSTNMQNIRRAPAGKKYSRLLGANWDKSTESWKSCIRVDGKHKHLGRYKTEQEAHQAYLAAKRLYHAGCTI